MFNELSSKIEQLEKEITKLKKEIKNQGNNNWYPNNNKNESAYIIYGTGSVHYIETNDFSQEYLDAIYTMNNIFKTREEAEFEVERRKVIIEIERMADGVMDGHTLCCILSYNPSSHNIFVDFYYCINYGIPIFSSRKKAQECIDTIGEERLKKYYFRV